MALKLLSKLSLCFAHSKNTKIIGYSGIHQNGWFWYWYLYQKKAVFVLNSKIEKLIVGSDLENFVDFSS